MSTSDITIVLRPLPDARDPAIRLRHLLKQALRQHRLKCVSISDGQPTQAREDRTSGPPASPDGPG